MTIDLNADMGEYANDAQADIDAALMPLVSSCSIACGGHAGDVDTMRRTAQLAKASGVNIGAHPSYPDRQNFGRKSMALDLDRLAQSITTQIKSLRTVLDADGLSLAHVKPHGALYNDAAKDPARAAVIIAAADGVPVIGPPGSALAKAAHRAGAPFAREGFADRLYQQDGALTPRSQPGAVIDAVDARAAQARAIAAGSPFAAADGALTLTVDTICIHSDTPGAVETAVAIRAALEADDVQIRAFGGAL